MKHRTKLLSAIGAIATIFGSAAASAQGGDPPSFSAALSQTTVSPGQTSTLTLGIRNTEVTDATGVGFQMNFPAGLVIATPSNLATTCTGGTLTGTAGGNTVSYTGGTVGANSSCSVTVDVIGAAAGEYTIITGSLTSNFGNSGTASTTLTVTTAEALLGAALNVSVSGAVATFDVYLENFDTGTVSEILATQNLDAVFGAGNHSIASAPVLIDDPGTIILNPGFNGRTNRNLITPPAGGGRDSTGSTLVAGDTAQIRFTVNVTNVANLGSGLGNYQAQTSVSGKTTGGLTTDLSDDGTDPDPNGNGDAGDAGEDDPSAFTVGASPSIGLARTLYGFFPRHPQTRM